MEIIRGIHNLKLYHYGCALTIGNFDGFHRGHQALIKLLQSEGRTRNLPVIVMIFEPQPQEYFSANALRLTLLRDKIKYLNSAGVDAVLCINFNEKFAKISAHEFINDLLINKLKIQIICVGKDFRFGAQRKGNFTLLKQAGYNFGFKVSNIFTHFENGLRISSSIIRQVLMQDDLIKAKILLGHSYRISGRVVHGNALGRTIGFPTANILFKNQRIPLNGVYAVEVYGITNNPLLGVANIDIYPNTIGLVGYQRLEVYLLNILGNINLYGHYIEVIIRVKIRSKKKFDSLEALKQQIKKDVISTQKYFGF